MCGIVNQSFDSLENPLSNPPIWLAFVTAQTPCFEYFIDSVQTNILCCHRRDANTLEELV